jgi:starch synthase
MEGRLLEWNKTINPLASAVKCAWKVTTVSPTYMEELKHNANGLENLFQYETGKSVGILNGIDADVWDPSKDNFLIKNYDDHLVKEGKKKNKKELCGHLILMLIKPLIVFIGRLVGEKAADLLPDAIRNSVYQHQGNANFLVLGSGDPVLEDRLDSMRSQFGGYYNSYIGFNEGLSHQMYAGADFY